MVGLRSSCVVAFIFVLMTAYGAYAHDPIPDWDACPSPTSGASRFAPLPTFVQNTVGSPVTAWPPVGSYDFCAYMDTIYCQFVPTFQIFRYGA